MSFSRFKNIVNTGVTNVNAKLANAKINTQSIVGNTLKLAGNSLNTADLAIQRGLNVANNIIFNEGLSNNKSFLSNPVVSPLVFTGSLAAAVPIKLGQSALSRTAKGIINVGNTITPDSATNNKFAQYNTKLEKFNNKLKEDEMKREEQRDNIVSNRRKENMLEDKINNYINILKKINDDIDHLNNGFTLKECWERGYSKWECLEKKNNEKRKYLDYIQDVKEELNELRMKNRATTIGGGSKKTRRKKQSIRNKKSKRYHTRSKKHKNI